jgi:small subunit ribosomal protein S15
MTKENIKEIKEDQTKQAKPLKAAKVTNQDTGSVSFQVKNFTDKITQLTKHLQEHKHDFDSRRGLLIMVGKRRRLLNYIKKSDLPKYEELVSKLKLKR